MFSNYLVLNASKETELYLFINDYKSFKIYYKLLNNKNKLLKEIKRYININKIKNFKTIYIVLEGIIIDNYKLKNETF